MARKRNRVPMARSLRQQPVPTQGLLWKILRNRKLGGFKFRRQHPIGIYLADFACSECKVVVETDGESHLTTQTQDKERTRFLHGEG
jgi:very-short-patch-repair endonuclease